MHKSTRRDARSLATLYPFREFYAGHHYQDMDVFILRQIVRSRGEVLWEIDSSTHGMKRLDRNLLSPILRVANSRILALRLHSTMIALYTQDSSPSRVLRAPLHIRVLFCALNILLQSLLIRTHRIMSDRHPLNSWNGVGYNCTSTGLRLLSVHEKKQQSGETE